MSYTFQARFSGLCTFVRNSAAVPGRAQLCVVLPRANYHPAELTAVRGLFRDPSTTSYFRSIPIDDQRVEFSFDQDHGVQDEFIYVTKTKSGRQGFIELAQVIGQLAATDPSAVGTFFSSAVRGKVFLDRGTMEPDSGAPHAVWLVPQKAINKNNRPIEVEVADKMLWTVRQVVSAHVILTRSDGARVFYDLVTDAANQCVLAISNDCGKESSEALDKDFRFHYNLLDFTKKEALETVITALELDREVDLLPARKPKQEVIDILAGLVDTKNSRPPSDPVEALLLERDIERYTVKSSSSGCNCLGAGGGSLAFPENKVEGFSVPPPSAQFVTDETGKRVAIIVPIEEWERSVQRSSKS